MTTARPKDCPCGSGRRYAACCRPYHDGVLSAPTPEALMRSRYAAFALGLGDYLVDTLAAGHVDRALPREELARELGRAKSAKRFMGLVVHEAREDGASGEVTFSARVFEKGVDQSFRERSRFVREGGAWRYLDGDIGPYRGGADDA